MITSVNAIFESTAHPTFRATIAPPRTEREFLEYVAGLRSFATIELSQNGRMIKVVTPTERQLLIYDKVLTLADTKRTHGEWLGQGGGGEPITFLEWIHRIYPWQAVKPTWVEPRLLVPEAVLLEAYNKFARELNRALVGLTRPLEPFAEIHDVAELKAFTDADASIALTLRWKTAAGTKEDLSTAKSIGYQIYMQYGVPYMEKLKIWEREYFTRVGLAQARARHDEAVVKYADARKNETLVIQAIKRRFREVLDGDYYRRGIQVGDRSIYEHFSTVA